MENFIRMWNTVHPVTDDKKQSLSNKNNYPVLVNTTYSNKTRWRAGDRLHHLFEQRCDRFGWFQARKKVAIEYADNTCSYAELERLSNRLARYLIHHGVQPDDRVALLFDRSVYSYAAVLALSKIGAAYVPLDISFPARRIGFF